jgi:hypothetical protein
MSQAPSNLEADTTTIITAWSTLAPAASFGGMTLAQFKAKVQPSFDARTALEAIEVQQTSAIDTRNTADVVTSATNQLVVNGVKGDPNYGDDSELYDTMGYVRKSARRSGLTKKNKASAAAKKT